jgi:hypothetical protein
MIDSLAIQHWHKPNINEIEIVFFVKRADGSFHGRHYTPKENSLRRFMELIWRHTLRGRLEMMPMCCGSTTHWTYTITPVKQEAINAGNI